MPSRQFAVALAVVCSWAACGRHGGSGQVIGSANFSAAEPVFLDSILRVTFGVVIDPSTVNDGTLSVVAVEGPGVGVPTRGTWRAAGVAVEFVPELAHQEPLATSGGLQPGTRYELRVRGGEDLGGLRATDGRALPAATFPFVTRAGSTVWELITNHAPGGPRLVDFDVAPKDSNGDASLGRAFAPTTMTLRFDQPLHPGAAKLPRLPTATEPGPFVLTWDDPLYGVGTRVELAVELLQNNIEGAIVVLQPRGVLPSNATMQLRIADTLRDLFGHDNVGAFVEPVREFTTEVGNAQRADALLFALDDPAVLGDTDFAELPAVIEDGALRVPDTFPTVDADVGDWVPLGSEVSLSTASQTLTYQNGVTKTFTGGVLQMHNLHIPAGYVVRGIGPNPLVLVVAGDAVIEGVLSADGREELDTLGHNVVRPGDWVPPAPSPGEPWIAPPAFGPLGGPGGGGGGSVGWIFTSLPSASGGSAAGTMAGGGQGGQQTCGYPNRASAGGGGGAAVQGDPWLPTDPQLPGTFVQREGIGGASMGGSLAGGLPGEPWFTNVDLGDDFWGRAWVPQRRAAVIGELEKPRGGSGGGSGGSSWGYCPLPPGGPWVGGLQGGGGGGVLVVQVRGKLTIATSGRVSANGGDGTGVISYYSEQRGAGGGGGGGTVVLMAGHSIELHVRGGTFVERDYDFSISADGGACHETLGPVSLRGKYPANGQLAAASAYDLRPLGGFGGMGLVQLMVPVGRDNLDGTNTVLDDAIDVVRDGQLLLGFDKQRYLGWRGFPDDDGVLVDDFGMPTGTIGGMGDIRPDPVLLPVPFASEGKARARSRWLPLGALHRRALTQPDGLPRGVLGAATTFGQHARQDGWLPHVEGELSPLTAAVPLLSAPVLIASATLDASTLAVPALRVALAGDLPFVTPGAFTGTVADCTRALGGSWTQRRVLHSDARTLWLDGDPALPVQVDRLQLRAWYAELATDSPGSYAAANGAPLPRANVRIGFAFHRVPAAALVRGLDPERFPATVGTFLYDLSAPSTRAVLRAFGPRAVMWDVVLDGEWATASGDQPPPADQDSAIALRRFFLPVRY